MSVHVLTGATELPVSVAEAKQNSLIKYDLDDEFIEGLIEAAVGVVEADSSRALMPQVRRYTLDRFPCGRIQVPIRPIRQIEIKYIDTAGELQTLEPAKYDADLQPVVARVDPISSWPATAARMNAVMIDAYCGYEDAQSVPPRLKQAIKLLVSHWYENREATSQVVKVSQVPMAYELCLDGMTVPDFWGDE